MEGLPAGITLNDDNANDFPGDFQWNPQPYFRNFFADPDFAAALKIENVFVKQKHGLVRVHGIFRQAIVHRPFEMRFNDGNVFINIIRESQHAVFPAFQCYIKVVRLNEVTQLLVDVGKQRFKA